MTELKLAHPKKKIQARKEVDILNLGSQLYDLDLYSRYFGFQATLND